MRTSMLVVAVIAVLLAVFGAHSSQAAAPLDIVIRGGENVYCVEVENVLFDHPDVLDAAIVGVPHRTLGEEVKAVVQLRTGSTTTSSPSTRKGRIDSPWK